MKNLKLSFHETIYPPSVKWSSFELRAQIFPAFPLFRKLPNLLKKLETILLKKEIQPFLGNQIKGSEIQLSEPRFISFPPELLTLIQSIQCQKMPNYAQAAAAVRQKKERALLEKPGNQVLEKAGSQAKTRREKERQVETACKQYLDICHNGDSAES